MSIGKITQIIGAVIDVEFPSDAIPKVYNALHVTKANLTLEVQQQLGDNVVRAIAMGGSEGLQRGLEVTNTGKAITVPVGTKTCLLYTSPSPRDLSTSRMPSSA